MKKFLLTLVATVVLCFAIAITACAATTYYCDKDGKLIEDSTSDQIAYEFDLDGNNIKSIYLHDLSTTTIIIPNLGKRTNLQSYWQDDLDVYALADRGNEVGNGVVTEYDAQIKKIVVYNEIVLSGAKSGANYWGTFNGFSALEELHFYNKVIMSRDDSNKGGMFNNCTSLKELHFYGKDLEIRPGVFKNVPNNEGVTWIFHETASGKIGTADGTYDNGAWGNAISGSKNNWKIIINENMVPLDGGTGDFRFGRSTASGVTFYLAVTNKNNYTPEQLVALQTSHGFYTPAASMEASSPLSMIVKTYCELGYDEHKGTESSAFADDAFISNYIISCVCEKCGKTDVLETIAPLFVDRGFAYGPSSMLQGVAVDRALLETYAKYFTGIKFGLVAAAKSAQDSAEIINANGEGVNGYVAAVDYTERDYDLFEMNLFGISEGYQATELYFGAYVIADGQVYYIHNGTTNNEAQAITYNDVVVIVDALVPEKEEE